MTARRRAVPMATGVPAVGLFAWWATADGGYAPGAWYPGALLLLVALAVTARPAGYRALTRPGRVALLALARDERNWQAQAQLALLDLDAGHRDAAVAGLRRAQALNPRDGSIAEALAAVQAGDAPAADIADGLAELAMPGPIGPHPVDCRPVLGLGSSCGRER